MTVASFRKPNISFTVSDFKPDSDEAITVITYSKIINISIKATICKITYINILNKILDNNII